MGTHPKAQEELFTTMPEPRRDLDRNAVSDGEVPTNSAAGIVGTIDKKQKRIRRKRGNRYRPYHKLSPEEKLAITNSEEDKSARRRERLGSLGKVMAPCNTTQFLLEDREARAEAERQMAAAYEAKERCRVRSVSVSSELLYDGNASTSGESDVTDKELDKEFEVQLEEYNMDRLSRLSPGEMTQEVLEKEKLAEDYHEQFINTAKENERLRALLRTAGIACDESKA